MDNQLRLATGDDQTLADAAETINICEQDLGLLKHKDHGLDPEAWTARVHHVEQQRRDAEAILRPHVPPETWILVGHAPYQWELYRNPQTGRISSTPYRPDLEADPDADEANW